MVGQLTSGPEILDFANAVGALTCLGEGAIPSLPSMAAARAFQMAGRTG